MKYITYQITIPLIGIFLILSFLAGGMTYLNQKISDIDNTSLLLKEISELQIENEQKGITIVNQQEIIDNQASEIWSMAKSCGL